MSTKRETIDRLEEQLSGEFPMRIQAMFGEYALYVDEKLVALICDDQLYVKKTAYGEQALGAGHEAPPYPGAKPALRIPNDRLQDTDWLIDLVRQSAAELPLPKPKAPKKPRT